MVYQWSQGLPSAGKKRLYEITTIDNVINKFRWFFHKLMGRDRKKTWHKLLISDWYKYQ